MRELGPGGGRKLSAGEPSRPIQGLSTCLGLELPPLGTWIVQPRPLSCPSPRPSQASLNLKSDIFSSPPFWAFPTQGLGLEAGAGVVGEGEQPARYWMLGSHSEGCRVPLSGQRVGSPGTASPEPGPRRGRGVSPETSGEGLWSEGRPGLASALEVGWGSAGWAEGSSHPQLWGNRVGPVIWMNAWVSGLGVGGPGWLMRNRGVAQQYLACTQLTRGSWAQWAGSARVFGEGPGTWAPGDPGEDEGSQTARRCAEPEGGPAAGRALEENVQIGDLYPGPGAGPRDRLTGLPDVPLPQTPPLPAGKHPPPQFLPPPGPRLPPPRGRGQRSRLVGGVGEGASGEQCLGEPSFHQAPGSGRRPSHGGTPGFRLGLLAAPGWRRRWARGAGAGLG